MKTNIFRGLTIILVFCLLSPKAQSQIEEYFKEKGERYFSFTISNKTELDKLSGIISIDRTDGNQVIANANLQEFLRFLEFGLDYRFLPHPAELLEDVALSYEEIKTRTDWNFYPTYDGYVGLMNGFAANYPTLCQIYNIGTLNSGRQLLVARISKDVGQPGTKPRFLLTSSMHGDELTGYVLSLHLIDYLLLNYGSDPKVTRLVDSIDIWINPLANPDGTYYGGNNTVTGAIRRNANNVDLNRNYPDPAAGPNPDGNAWQPETIAFMNFAEQYKFNISSNIHGGAEVCNYPWDTWQQLTADNAWWVYTMREYADTVHAYSPPPYFRSFNNGITNGYAWYSITGGRQDYMNYFQNCREFCLEISNNKTPPAAQLPTFWNYNYHSFLNYIEQSLYGLRGTVTNSVTGTPVRAKVEIIGFDINNSFVYSNASAGNYHRYLIAGTYNITFSAPCYETITIPNVSVGNRQTTWLNVQMTALPLAADFQASSTAIIPGQQITFSDASCGNITGWSWYFDGGNPIVSNAAQPVVTYAIPGVYDVMLVVTDGSENDTIIKQNYIRVAPPINMVNGAYSSCLANFYDSGGPNGNYSSNENFILTFNPSISDGKVKVTFTHFDLEASANCAYDWLKIYNGTNTSATLIGEWCGVNSPGTITATNTSGALTFHFKSDNSVNKSGWAALIECIPPAMAPLADFGASATLIYEGDTVFFSNLSTGYPTSYLWHFEGGMPASSTLKNPYVIYPEPGLYAVTLQVSNAHGSNTKTIQNYIEVDEGVGLATYLPMVNFRAFPNPVTQGILNIISDSSIGMVEIQNTMGQVLLSHRTNALSVNLDVRHIQPGIYILRVRNSSGTAAGKILVH